jgi:hypothetical protein
LNFSEKATILCVLRTSIILEAIRFHNHHQQQQQQQQQQAAYSNSILHIRASPSPVV